MWFNRKNTEKNVTEENKFEKREYIKSSIAEYNNESETALPIEISVKGLILAVVVIISCILAAISLYMVQRGKSTINSANNQYSVLMSDYTELDKTIYDGLEVSGDDVISLIDSLAADNTVSVDVHTLVNQKAKEQKGKTYCAEKYIKPAKNDADYINPSATFKGKVTKNGNGIVTSISFIQL